ncbi:DEAD/DEAH box helicase family protein [Candidatus Pacearchaeota archaeon]|nr:DEAD/DEAH box helicase family protein [Candidatus Pacearchaeota archaeon]
MTLWDFQSSNVDQAIDFYDHGGRSLLIQQPTGTGKSLVAREIVNRLYTNNKPVYFVTHSKNLLWQFSDHLTDIGLKHGIIAAGCPIIRYKIQVISVQSLKKRMKFLDEPSLLIFEEAHHSSSSMFKDILNYWTHTDLLGITATTNRPDGTPLGDIYEELILSPQVSWFIENYYLSDYDYFVPEELDTSGIHHRYGDFAKNEILLAVDKKTIIGNLADHYEKYAPELPGIISGVNIKHAEDIRDLFIERGISTQAIHSKIKGNVKTIIDNLKAGGVKLISFCDMLGEGVSVNGLSTLIMGRPTDSLVIDLQQIGRILRAVYDPGYDLSTKNGRRAAMEAGGKGKAVIIDPVSNYTRHGLPDDDRTWSLTGKLKTDKGRIDHKRCPDCLRPVSINVRICPFCRFQWTETAEAVSRIPEEKAGTLVNVRNRREKQDLTIRIAREAHNLKQAVKIAAGLGINHREAWQVWTQVLKNKVDEIIYF